MPTGTPLYFPHVRGTHPPTPFILINSSIFRYGETVTLMDMRGIAKKPRRMAAGAKSVKVAGGNKELAGPAIGGAVGLMVAAKMKSRIHRQRNKAPTETHNSAYLEAIQQWKPKDFISSQVQKAATLREKTRLRKQAEYVCRR